MFEYAFVDMDGVLVDFVSAALGQHGKHYIANNHSLYTAGVDVADFLELNSDEASKERFWEPIHKIGSSFWFELKPLPWYQEVIAAAKSVAGEVKILTSPGRECRPVVYEGKKRWLNYHGFGDYEFLPFKSKYLVAAPGRLLIDDDEKNIEQFKVAGGEAILFPSLTNSAHEQVASAMFHFGRSLYALEEAMKRVQK